MSEKRKLGRPPIYPWLEMNVEDRFTLPYLKPTAAVYVSQANKKYAPRKFKAFEDSSGVFVKRIA